MGIKKVKISELPLTEVLEGLFTIGVDKFNKSVRVSLQFLKTQVDKVNAADAAAKMANDAAAAAVKATNNANTKAELADTQASAARDAAALANQKAQDANVTIIRLEELEESLVGQYKMIPTDMVLEYPSRITLRNTVPNKIGYSLLPTNTGRNVLFLGDDNAVSVVPDGSLIVRKPGISKIHVIPTENTTLYKTIEITVVEPVLRKVKASSLRIMGNGTFRLT